MPPKRGTRNKYAEYEQHARGLLGTDVTSLIDAWQRYSVDQRRRIITSLARVRGKEIGHEAVNHVCFMQANGREADPIVKFLEAAARMSALLEPLGMSLADMDETKARVLCSTKQWPPRMPFSDEMLDVLHPDSDWIEYTRGAYKAHRCSLVGHLAQLLAQKRPKELAQAQAQLAYVRPPQANLPPGRQHAYDPLTAEEMELFARAIPRARLTASEAILANFCFAIWRASHDRHANLEDLNCADAWEEQGRLVGLKGADGSADKPGAGVRFRREDLGVAQAYWDWHIFKKRGAKGSAPIPLVLHPDRRDAGICERLPRVHWRLIEGRIATATDLRDPKGARRRFTSRKARQTGTAQQLETGVMEEAVADHSARRGIGAIQRYTRYLRPDAMRKHDLEFRPPESRLGQRDPRCERCTRIRWTNEKCTCGHHGPPLVPMESVKVARHERIYRVARSLHGVRGLP